MKNKKEEEEEVTGESKDDRGKEMEERLMMTEDK